jgi:hypothetical protein
VGRTILIFSLADEHEKRRWKSFLNAPYDKSDRKDFDDMFDFPRSYTLLHVITLYISLRFVSY